MKDETNSAKALPVARTGLQGVRSGHSQNRRLARVKGSCTGESFEPRYCMCADPENCTEAVPGCICKAGKTTQAQRDCDGR